MDHNEGAMQQGIVRNRTRADLARAKQRQAGTGARSRSQSTRDQGRRKPSPPTVDESGLPMLRTSERGTFKRCRHLWWNEFVDLRKPNVSTPPLRFGNLIHASLAAYYIPGKKRGVRPWITFEELYAKECLLQESFGFRVAEDEKWVKAGDLGPAMLKHYVEHYTSGIPSLPDEMFEILHTEVPFRQVVYKPWTYDPNYPAEAQATAEPWFIYVGIIDGFWRNLKTKKIHIVDHKTAAAINLQYLSLDDQSTSYWTWGLDWAYQKGILLPSEKPAGMLFNIMRKQFKDERPTSPEGMATNKPLRKHYLAQLTGKPRFNPKWKLAEMEAYAEHRSIVVTGEVSQKQPAPYFARVPIYRNFEERESARSRVLQEYADMEVIKKERDGYYKNPSQFTCPGCWLFDACELHEIGADYEELLKLTTKSWDPYDVHEIEAAERK